MRQPKFQTAEDPDGSWMPGARWTWPDSSGPWGLPSLFAVVVLSYGLGSQLALLLIEASDLQGVLFIPSGITVAFLLRLRRGHWWVVLLAAGLTEFVMDVNSGLAVQESLGFAIANVAEPLIGAAIVATASHALDLARRRDLLWYALGAVLAGPAAGAAIGAASDRLLGGDDYLTTFAQWWLGDALGVVLVGSAIVAWGSSRDRRSIFTPSGALLVVGSIVVTVGVVTYTDLPLVFSVLVGVVLAGALFGISATATTSLTVAMTLAVVIAVDPGALIVGLTPGSALVLIKLQVGIYALAGLLIAAESNERDLATRLLAQREVETAALDIERQREHDLAVRIQRGLLPDQLYQPPGAEIAARYEAASDAFEVGGDWYDTILLSDGRVGMVVGDIMGHGIEAMTAMGRLRTALSALAMRNSRPASVLAAVDQFVATPDGAAYATVFYAVVDTVNNTIEFASAGHPPGLLVSPDGTTAWLEQANTEPLYGKPSGPRQQASAQFEPGAILVLYSDGLIERRGESLSFGLERLSRLASNLVDRDAESICDEFFNRFLGAERADDAVVVALKTYADRASLYREVFPARSEELASVRSSVRSWMAARGLPEPVRLDLLIALGEATANAVRHAYGDSAPGEMEIRMRQREDVVFVDVMDRGAWHERSDASDTPGLGLSIIRSLAPDLRIVDLKTGTRVSFEIPLSDVQLYEIGTSSTDHQ